MKKTEYEKQVERINEICSGINWEADKITDILYARDHVEIPDNFEGLLSSLESELETIRLDID